MKLSINRQQGLVGLYWVRGIKSLNLSLTEHFGLTLSFEFNKQEKAKFSTVMLHVIEEKSRVQALTNAALVDEVAGTEYADNPAVSEMMDRLDPGRYEKKND